MAYRLLLTALLFSACLRTPVADPEADGGSSGTDPRATEESSSSGTSGTIDPEELGIECGELRCSIGEVCGNCPAVGDDDQPRCLSTLDQARALDCKGNLLCDGPEDCGLAQACRVVWGGAFDFESSCDEPLGDDSSCINADVLCQVDDDCPDVCAGGCWAPDGSNLTRCTQG